MEQPTASGVHSCGGCDRSSNTATTRAALVQMASAAVCILNAFIQQRVLITSTHTQKKKEKEGRVRSNRKAVPFCTFFCCVCCDCCLIVCDCERECVACVACRVMRTFLFTRSHTFESNGSEKTHQKKGCKKVAQKDRGEQPPLSYSPTSVVDLCGCEEA